MDDADEIKGIEFYASVLTPATPQDLKEAFGMMIDEVIAQAEGVVIDWGSVIAQTSRALTAEHQELIVLQMGVEGIGFGTAEE